MRGRNKGGGKEENERQKVVGEAKYSRLGFNFKQTKKVVTRACVLRAS